MDTFGALSLATEPPVADILTRAPYSKDDPIMSAVMWRNVLGHALYQCAVLGYVIFAAPGSLLPSYWNRCTLEDNVCKAGTYNPYYANTLYMDNDALNAWKRSSLTESDFNQDLLAAWRS